MADIKKFRKDLMDLYGTADPNELNSNSVFNEDFAESVKKKKVVGYDSFGREMPTPEPQHLILPERPAVQVSEGWKKADGSMANPAMDATAKPSGDLVYGKPPETSNIDTLTDRYGDMYADSTKALTKFNKKAFGDGSKGGLAGGSKRIAAYNSPERGGLMMQNRQAFDLLQKGSFADNANIKKESRINQMAQANANNAAVPYKKALGQSAISGANLQRKAFEAMTAQGAKKKKKPFDIDELAADMDSWATTTGG